MALASPNIQFTENIQELKNILQIRVCVINHPNIESSLSIVYPSSKIVSVYQGGWFICLADKIRSFLAETGWLSFLNMNVYFAPVYLLISGGHNSFYLGGILINKKQ